MLGGILISVVIVAIFSWGLTRNSIETWYKNEYCDYSMALCDGCFKRKKCKFMLKLQRFVKYGRKKW